MNAFLVLLAIVVVLALDAIAVYNSPIAKQNKVASIEASVDTQLKRMFPSNIVANYMDFKKAAFFDIPQNQSETHNVGELFKRG